MKTSYFGATPKGTPGAIAISLHLPQWCKFPHYPKLAPSQDLLTRYKKGTTQGLNPERYYTFRYFNQLRLLDPQQVWDELHEIAAGYEPTILCYEGEGKFCHRRLVAKWFEVELGYNVEEQEVMKTRKIKG
jgi:uncharacterized protein YeaO (DUF488 family)